MRRRAVLLTVLIVAVLGISVVALALPEIHIGIPGLPRIDRSATGPLGLKLGLDLQGGAHLVYQAETGTTLAVSLKRAPVKRAPRLTQTQSLTRWPTLDTRPT